MKTWLFPLLPWIAACCMSVGGTLLTRDRHFHAVGQIDKIILN
jgi:predicted nucleic acid-binding protein